MESNENRPFDFRMLLAFALMFAIITAYSMYFQPKPEEKPPAAPTQSETIPADRDTFPSAVREPGSIQAAADSLIAIPGPDSTISADTIRVETPLYTAEFSTLGADLVSYHLNDYYYITDSTTDRPISLLTKGAKSALRFEFWGKPLQLWNRGFTSDQAAVVLTKNEDSTSLVFTWQYDQEYEIKKTYIFFPDKYSFDIVLSIPQGFPLTVDREYTFGWDPGLGPSELREEDIKKMAAVAMLGQDIEEIEEIDDADRPKRFGGLVKWAGVHTKYFANIIIPDNVEPQEFIADRHFGTIMVKDKQFKIPYFSSRFAVPVLTGQQIEHRYSVYMGPLDYFVVKGYGDGLEGLISLGWRYIIRPFAIFVLWSFDKLYTYVPNYGFVIILFGFLVKLLFHPLTKKSMASMQRMKDMSPKLQKLKEKYKDDPQRLNRETMKMYKETGFNPVSGCLPLLAQMPVFYALYQVLRNTIQMRGADFIFQITDLSQKDPLYILPIIMTISFFWQQKMTSTDPKQKALVYVMPLMFGFLFMNSPAGLTLYWTVYNVFSVIEQYIIKRAGKKDEPAPAT